VFVLLQYVQAPLHLAAGIGRGFKPYALTLGAAAAAEKLRRTAGSWQAACSSSSERAARCFAPKAVAADSLFARRKRCLVQILNT
jgi:invasion protein IalB